MHLLGDSDRRCLTSACLPITPRMIICKYGRLRYLNACARDVRRAAQRGAAGGVARYNEIKIYDVTAVRIYETSERSRNAAANYTQTLATLDISCPVITHARLRTL